MHYHRVFENIVCISKKFVQEGFQVAEGVQVATDQFQPRNTIDTVIYII